MAEYKILLNLVLCSDMGLVCETCDSLSSQAQPGSSQNDTNWKQYSN